MSNGISIQDGSDRVMSKIVGTEMDTSKSPPIVKLTLSCGCTVTRTLPRVPRGSNMYCEECRERNRKKSSK